jgi:dihydroorotase
VAHDTVTLVARPWQVPASYDYLPNDPLVPLMAGETLMWQVEEQPDDA